MNESTALLAFAALSQPTRLNLFRMLVRAGGSGMLSGEIAVALGVRQNTMSARLAVLLQAGLVRNAREGCGIRYFADMEGLQNVLAFLLEDCCGGRPDLCRPLLNDLVSGC